MERRRRSTSISSLVSAMNLVCFLECLRSGRSPGGVVLAVSFLRWQLRELPPRTSHTHVAALSTTTCADLSKREALWRSRSATCEFKVKTWRQPLFTPAAHATQRHVAVTSGDTPIQAHQQHITPNVLSTEFHAVSLCHHLHHRPLLNDVSLDV